MRKARAFAAAFTVFALTAALTGCKAVGLLSGLLNKQEVEYDNPAEKWRNEIVHDSEAKNDAIAWLLSAADSDDRSAFAEIFAPVVASGENFSAQLDSFFEAYPTGFSECELNSEGGSGSGSYNYGDAVETYSASYTCFLDGEWFYISVAFCYQNTMDPDEVGITFFCIENLEAFALDESYSEDIVCNIVDESRVTARLIDGRGFVFEPTPERSVTLEQMREYLEKCDKISQLTEIIGEPNVTKKYSNATGCDYYYELESSDGSPLYAYIVAGYLSGEIYYGYVCTDEKILFDVILIDE